LWLERRRAAAAKAADDARVRERATAAIAADASSVESSTVKSDRAAAYTTTERE
jgi:hypothetical protein